MSGKRNKWLSVEFVAVLCVFVFAFAAAQEKPAAKTPVIRKARPQRISKPATTKIDFEKSTGGNVKPGIGRRGSRATFLSREEGRHYSILTVPKRLRPGRYQFRAWGRSDDGGKARVMLWAITGKVRAERGLGQLGGKAAWAEMRGDFNVLNPHTQRHDLFVFLTEGASVVVDDITITGPLPRPEGTVAGGYYYVPPGKTEIPPGDRVEELTENGGFEMPDRINGWTGRTGAAAVLRVAQTTAPDKIHSGNRALYLHFGKDPDNRYHAPVSGQPYGPVHPGARYHVTFFAKGKGRVEFGGYCGIRLPLSAERWKRFEFTLVNAKDFAGPAYADHVQKQQPLWFFLGGKDSWVAVDDVSIKVDRAKYPPPTGGPTTPGEMWFGPADCQVFLNGEEVKLAAGGRTRINFRQGENLVAVKAIGDPPQIQGGLRFHKFPDQPFLTDEIWKGLRGKEDPGWTQADFDDKLWLPAKTAEKDSILAEPWPSQVNLTWDFESGDWTRKAGVGRNGSRGYEFTAPRPSAYFILQQTKPVPPGKYRIRFWWRAIGQAGYNVGIGDDVRGPGKWTFITPAPPGTELAETGGAFDITNEGVKTVWIIFQGNGTIVVDDVEISGPLPGTERELTAAEKTTAYYRRSVFYDTPYYFDGKIDRFYFPIGSTEFVTFVNHAPTQAPVTSLELELDVPAFLEYVGKGKGTSAAFGDCAPYKVTSRNTTRDGKPYKRYRISAPPIHRGKAVFEQGLLKRFQVGDQLSPVWPTRAKSTCAILFTLPKSARGVAPGQQFHIYHRRIINGNKTDFIESFPMEIMPPLTGRCPKRFKLWNHPTPWSYSGASPSEAPNVCDLLLKRNTAMGVRILHAPVGAESYLRATYRRMHKAGYTMEVGWCNGMNYLMTPEGAGRDKWTGTGLRFLYEHPEYQARWYTGNKERLLAATAGMSPRIHDPDIPPEKQPFMWCQQYVAEGGKHYLDRWRAQLKREYADVIPGPKVLVWDWEYATMKNSCFCRRCIAAFKKYARLRASAEITPEIMAADHTLKWIDFRMQQSADHIRSFRKMANKLGIELCVYTSGGDLDEPRGGLKWEIIGDAPNWAWLGWPGNTGKGGIHLRNTERTFDNLTEYVGPNVRLVGQVMYLTYWPSGGSDPRQRKIDLVKAACYTRSAMSVWSRTGYGGLTDQAGTSYWTAQAMDFIARYEDFLLDGTRSRVSVQVEGIDAETNLTAFDHKGERLVLLFNETRKPLEVAVTVRNVPAGKRPHFNDSRTPLKDDGPHRLTLPLMNVSVLHYR